MPDGDLDFDVVDVFAERPFAGNQLAVVHGAEALDDAQLVAIAREFNYSETTFPTPLEDGRYAVRIFTPGRELPFAGHPTLGTAWVLREQGLLVGETVVQECGAGEIGVRFDGGLVELSATPRDLAGPLSREVAAELLADLGLAAEDLAGDAWVAGAGLSFVHLPVMADAVARARPGGRPLTAYAGLPDVVDPLEGINLVALEPGGSRVEVHARVFVSVAEDPATGSAAAGLGLAMVASGVLPEGGGYTIAQGLEMGRPSSLHGRVEAEDGVATAVHVAGRVQPVSFGRIRVPPR
jgi:trans-2,3-dihydro-3-hydroxyanthranilate isomerase